MLYALILYCDSKLSSCSEVKLRRVEDEDDDAVVERFIVPYDIQSLKLKVLGETNPSSFDLICFLFTSSQLKLLISLNVNDTKSYA